MIEAKFEYSYPYIKELNNSIMKTYNVIGQISLFLIFCGIAVMFAVVQNILLGVLSAATFVILIVGFVCANIAVERSNRALLGQQVKIQFGEDEMNMTATMGEQTIYTAKFEYAAIKSAKAKNNLMYIMFDKKSAVVVPKSAFKTEAEFTKVLERVSNNYVM